MQTLAGFVREIIPTTKIGLTAYTFEKHQLLTPSTVDIFGLLRSLINGVNAG